MPGTILAHRYITFSGAQKAKCIVWGKKKDKFKAKSQVNRRMAAVSSENRKLPSRVSTSFDRKRRFQSLKTGSTGNGINDPFFRCSRRSTTRLIDRKCLHVRVVASHENSAPRGLAWNQQHFYNMYLACWQTAGMRSV